MQHLRIDIQLPLDRFDLEVDFTVRETVTGLFGPSGSGKTSLLEVILGWRREVRGRIVSGDVIWLDSERKHALPPEQRSIGYVPQEGLLFPHLDVRGNLLAGADRLRQGGGSPEKELLRIAELLELTPLLHRDVETLSGGERQRVALGRALCSGPSLLLLDEPFAALDLPLRRRLLPLLARIRRELAVPMLMVSHDPVEVQALCDELIVLHRGRRVAQGDPRTVLAAPKTFALAKRPSFENVFPATLLRHGDGTSVLRLGEKLEWIAGASSAPLGAEVMIGLPANEILLATVEPQGLSARNALPATVRQIRRGEQHTLVHIELARDLPHLAVEVTHSTPARLGIASGSEVHAIVKATSCRIYG